MTKQYGVPGLRLGYITAHKDVMTKIKKLRMPWSVNGLAIKAGKFLVKNNPELLDIRNYLKETKRLQDTIHSIEGITTFPTDTHFFLCQLESKKASALKLWLIENYGILIRDASNFRGLNQHHFRIATQSPDENNRLINALQEWI
jgi:threonine-phosphate decarboxylase